MTKAPFLSVNQLYVKVNLVADVAKISFEVLKSVVKLVNKILIILRHDWSVKILIQCDMSRWCWVRRYESTDDTTTWFKLIDTLKDRVKNIVTITRASMHLIFRKIQFINAINTQDKWINQIFKRKVTQSSWHITINTQIVTTRNQWLNRSWAKLLRSDEQKTWWTAIQTRCSFTISLMSLSDFLSSILQLVYIRAIFMILSCKLHLLSNFSLLSRWHQLCRFSARTSSSLLWSHVHIEIAFLQHHSQRKKMSRRRRLSERISINL